MMHNYLYFVCYTKLTNVLLPVLLEKKNQHHCEMYKLSPKHVSFSRKIASISFYNAKNLFQHVD